MKRYLTDPRLQKARELWVAVGYGFLLKKLLCKEVWLRMVLPEHEPPDVLVLVKDPMDGKKYGEALVEITEADPFSFKREGKKPHDFILDRINLKATEALKSDYPKDMQLLVYCNITAKVDLDKIRNKLKNSKPFFSQIWLLGADDKDLMRISLWELWPTEQAETVYFA